MDVLAVHGRHEGAVQPLDGAMGERVALALDLLDLGGLVPDGMKAMARNSTATRRRVMRVLPPGNQCHSKELLAPISATGAATLWGTRSSFSEGSRR